MLITSIDFKQIFEEKKKLITIMKYKGLEWNKVIKLIFSLSDFFII
jgi:hypothetical protein